MRALPLGLGAGLMVLAAGMGWSAAQPEAGSSLKPASEFSAISNERERSIALFTEAGKVIQHPRCVNCHPAGDRPLQGDDGHLHLPLVLRGAGGFGMVGMQCPTCHQSANFDPGGVPGHPTWHLAPIEMAWAGKSLGEICAQIKNPDRNGGMSLDKLVHHMAEDTLVGWGWQPGAGRTPAPGTQQEFGALIRAWVDNGAACPEP
jgi:hypothetical protein